jgi:hypothetical protein
MQTCQAVKRTNDGLCKNIALEIYGGLYCDVHKAKFRPDVTQLEIPKRPVFIEEQESSYPTLHQGAYNDTANAGDLLKKS